jgi:ferredoxin
MKVIVDLKRCESNGRCYENFPDLFEPGPDKKAVLKKIEIPDDDFDMQQEARSAAMMCPKIAIVIEED